MRKGWSRGLGFFACQQVRRRQVSLLEGKTRAQIQQGRAFWQKLSCSKETGEVILMSKPHEITRKWAPWSSLTSFIFPLMEPLPGSNPCLQPPGCKAAWKKKEYPSGCSGPYEKNLIPCQVDMDHPAVSVRESTAKCPVPPRPSASELPEQPGPCCSHTGCNC